MFRKTFVRLDWARATVESKIRTRDSIKRRAFMFHCPRVGIAILRLRVANVNVRFPVWSPHPSIGSLLATCCLVNKAHFREIDSEGEGGPRAKTFFSSDPLAGGTVLGPGVLSDKVRGASCVVGVANNSP